MRFYRHFISWLLPVAALSPTVIPVLCPQASATVAAAGQNQEVAALASGQNDKARDPAILTRDPSMANISGTVTDVNGDVVPGATVELENAYISDRRTAIASENGPFQFGLLKPGTAYNVTVEAPGFQDWKSQTVILNPGQHFF